MQAIVSNRLRGWGATVLRAVVGLIFLAHGAQKLFGMGFGGVAGMMEGLGLPAPALAAGVLILVELVGGAALVLGLFTRLAAVPLAVSMLVATLMVHLPNGFYASSGGIEFTLLLTAACLALAMTGPGKAALDRIPATTVRRPKASSRQTATGEGSARGLRRTGGWENEQSAPYS